jgi:hypothetical protein
MIETPLNSIFDCNLPVTVDVSCARVGVGEFADSAREALGERQGRDVARLPSFFFNSPASMSPHEADLPGAPRSSPKRVA